MSKLFRHQMRMVLKMKDFFVYKYKSNSLARFRFCNGFVESLLSGPEKETGNYIA